MGVTRTVTVLFTDLVASTEQSTSLSLEAADDLRRAYFDLLDEAVAATGGEVVKNLGDGFMVAYESTAAAVAGAVAMQRAIDRHNRRPRASRLVMRIGVSVGEATHEDGDWFGPPVIEAARLCDEAAGGQVLSTDVVRALVRPRNDFGFEPLGMRELKGLAEPVPICEVTWDAEHATAEGLPPAMRADAPRTRFVGRADELARIEAAWDRARAGRHQLVLIAGEPGIGKTRLATELAVRAHAAGATVLFGRCYEETLTPYEPFVEALGQRGHELARLVPDWADRGAALPAVFQAGPDSERYLLFEAVSALFGELAEDAPVVVVLDDLHWADAPTLLLLQYLARRQSNAALLILGTYRETDLARDHPLSAMLGDLRRERLYERVSLRGLDEGELAALVADRAGDEPPAVFTRALHAETEGNPFFAEEVLLHLIETGAVYQRDGRWVSDATSIEELGIPEGIRDVIGRRLSRLSDTANKLLGVAAVLGREFSVRAAERVSRLDGDALLDALDEAAGARLVAEVAGDPDRYSFSHALIRQTLYDELGAARRMRFHQRAGDALEEFYAADLAPHLGELAYHFSQLAYGGDADKAVDYCVRAAERAGELLAFEEAVVHCRRALQVIDVADRGGTVIECDLRLALAEALFGAANYEASRAEARRAVELTRALDDRGRFVRAVAALVLAATPALGTVDPFPVDDEALVDEAMALVGADDHALRAGLLRHRVYDGRFGERTAEQHDAAVRDAIQAAQASGDPVALAAAHMTDFLYTTFSSDIERVRRLADELTALATRSRHPRTATWALMARAHLTLRLGDVAAVEGEFAAAAASESTRGDLYAAWVSLVGTAAVALLEGRFAAAEELATRAYGLGRPAFGQYAVGPYGLQLYALRRDQGRLAEMEAPLTDLLDRVRDQLLQGPAIQAGLAHLYFELDRLDEAAAEVERIRHDGRYRRLEAGVITVTNLAEVAAALEDRDLAAELYTRLRPCDGQAVVVGGDTYCNGAVARWLGILATCLGRRDDAERHYRDALAMNQRMGARPWVARTQLDLGRLLATEARNGDLERARALVDASRTTAEELGMPVVAARAQALAHQL